MGRIYMAGPINGCTDSECKDWRKEVSDAFSGSVIDPMTRDYRGQEDCAYKVIVELDKKDILRSSAVLVRYVKPSVGTSMEILFAYDNNIPVVVWADEGVPISPWLRYHSKVIVNDLKTAIKFLSQLR